MRHYFLGAGANIKHTLKYVFARGKEADAKALTDYLGQRYGGETILTKNGRSALCLILKTYFEPGDRVIINGFTCYAVVEACKGANVVPIYADISAENLNFTVETLENAWNRFSTQDKPKGIIIQNTLGNPVDIVEIEKFANEHNLFIIEDLAHSAGVRYPDGREAGTVGIATALSFGKEKSVDTILGGAAILRELNFKFSGRRTILPALKAKTSDNLRARFYPLIGKIYRGLSYVRLNGAFMRMMLALHWVERSADNRLDLTRKIANFEAKLALGQLLKLENAKPLRKFYLLSNRDMILADLRRAGYYFDGFWYERPVSPDRYYASVKFPESECPTAVAVSQRILNLPTYYTDNELAQAERIIREKGAVWNPEGKNE